MMTARSLLTTLTSLPLILVLTASCAPERDRGAEASALVRQEVEERLAEYERIRMDRCREELLKEATRLADSILLEEARLSKDTISKPPRPERPDKPDLRTLPDTIPVKPLLPARDSSKNS